MFFKDVDIFACKFFTLTPEKQLKFMRGKFINRTPEDFYTTYELHEAIGYCFWLLNNDSVPLVTKYLSSVFLSELSKKKVLELEKKLHEKIIEFQRDKTQETEDSIDDSGKEY